MGMIQSMKQDNSSNGQLSGSPVCTRMVDSSVGQVNGVSDQQGIVSIGHAYIHLEMCFPFPLCFDAWVNQQCTHRRARLAPKEVT